MIVSDCRSYSRRVQIMWLWVIVAHKKCDCRHLWLWHNFIWNWKDGMMILNEVHFIASNVSELPLLSIWSFSVGSKSKKVPRIEPPYLETRRCVLWNVETRTSRPGWKIKKGHKLGLFGTLKLALALQFIVTNAYFSVARTLTLVLHATLK